MITNQVGILIEEFASGGIIDGCSAALAQHCEQITYFSQLFLHNCISLFTEVFWDTITQFHISTVLSFIL